MAANGLPPGFASVASLKGAPSMRSRILGFGVGVDHVAGLVLFWPYHDLVGRVLELVEAVASDVLELRKDDARFCPFAILAEGDVADGGAERMASDVGGGGC